MHNFYHNFEYKEKRRRKLSYTYFQIAFGGKGFGTNGALERPITSVCPHVDLQGRAGGKVLFTNLTHVFVAAVVAAVALGTTTGRRVSTVKVKVSRGAETCKHRG